MAAIGAEPDEAGLDYLIGDPDLIGRGLGQEMLRSFIADVVLADPSIKGVRTNVSVANRRSWRCLEKLGFTREPDTRLLDDEPGPQYVLSYRSPSAR
jgi:aminoglycoside 6'-N-acetyltransferase